MSETKTIKNADLKPAIEALAALGRTSLPIRLAVRMVKLRESLVNHERAVDEVRFNKAKALSGSDRGFSSDVVEAQKHERWSEFVDAFNELMDEEYRLSDTFELYERQNGDGMEYAWTENFKAGRLKELEPNVLFHLRDIVTIVNVDPEPEPDGE